MSTEKRPPETVGEQAWNTFRAVVLATLIALVAIIAVMAWASNRSVEPIDWSKYQTTATTENR